MDPSLPPFHPDWLVETLGGWMVIPSLPAQECRDIFDGIFAAGVTPYLPPKTDAVQSQDLIIPNTTIKLRVYTPHTEKAKAESPLPVGLYIHAGGWFAGSIEHEDWVARYVCEHANIILFSPEYRLSPENPYPAGLDDCCTAYEYIHHHAAEFGGDPSRKLTMGGSAAGNLALAVAVKYADTDLKAVGLIAAALASCDPSVLPEEYKKRYTPELYTDAPVIGNDIVALARTWLAVPDRADPLFSPLLHPNLRLIPKIYVTACSKDPTHQETVFLAEECKKQGVDTSFVEWTGWPHYFWIMPNLPKTIEFLDIWNEKLRWMAGQDK